MTLPLHHCMVMELLLLLMFLLWIWCWWCRQGKWQVHQDINCQQGSKQWHHILFFYNVLAILRGVVGTKATAAAAAAAAAAHGDGPVEMSYHALRMWIANCFCGTKAPLNNQKPFFNCTTTSAPCTHTTDPSPPNLCIALLLLVVLAIYCILLIVLFLDPTMMIMIRLLKNRQADMFDF